MNPLIEYALHKVNGSMAVVDEQLDKVEEAIFPMIISLDIASMHTLRQLNKKIIEMLSEHLEEFNKKANILKKVLRAEDDVEVELDLWEYRRPIVYKIQRAEDIQKTIDKLLGA